MNYSQIEKESLAQAWGMSIHRYYLLGIQFDSYTDYQPVVPIYSGHRRGNARVERHRLKVQGFQYEMKYLPGKENPFDYQSRHPLPLETYSTQQLEDMVIDMDDELCINKIITDDLPDAVILPMIQTATKQDHTMQKLIKAIQKWYTGNDPDLKPYKHVFQELSLAQGVILRGDKLVIPEAEFIPISSSLRETIVDLAHQGVVKCKQLLRSRLWFPDLDKMVERKVAGCLACQATTYTPSRDPLKPSPLPDRPWQKIDIDLWGPLPSGEHVIVMVDEYSRYPEVEFVHSTSAAAVVPHVDKIFTTHGFPEQIKTDGGPPFNGIDTHQFQQYMKWAGIKHILVSPEDPKANGLADNFMKVVKKVWHTSHIEKKNFKQELFKYLRHYRATPHTSTGRAPSEIMFNRKIRTRLPAYQEPAHDPQLRAQHDKSKATQKYYKDAKSNVKPHNILIGDKVLLLQKESKTQSRYDPHPYQVTAIKGSQIAAQRDGKVRLRDAKMFKKVCANQPQPYFNQRYPLDRHREDPSHFSWAGRPTVPAPLIAAQPTTPVAIQPVAQHTPRTVPLATKLNLTQMAEQDASPPSGPRQMQGKQYHYPNRHLDPNIDVTLLPGDRKRHPPRVYDAKTGSWQ